MNKENVNKILNELGNVKLVVASKYVAASDIKDFVELGITNFGENRVDAFLSKYDELKDLNLNWHFIGHLQTNKAKLVLNKINFLHSLDSLKLASIIEQYRKETLDCYVEVHMTSSLTKDGVSKNDLPNFLEELKKYPKVHVIGLMAMTDKDMNDEQKLTLFQEVKELGLKYNLHQYSMGMSEDYKLALKAGTTCVRLGRIVCED